MPSDVIRRLQPTLDKVDGIQLFMQPVQNITVDDRVSRTQYQFSLEDADANELNLWTQKFVDKLQELPELQDVATDQQTGGLAVSLVIDRATASRLGIAPSTIDNTLYDAFGQRQINTMYTQLNQYHVMLEADPIFQQDPSLNKLYIQANTSSGASGGGGIFILLGLRIVYRRLQRPHHVDALHAVGQYALASEQRPVPQYVVWNIKYRGRFGGEYLLDNEQRRAPGFLHSFGK